MRTCRKISGENDDRNETARNGGKETGGKSDTGSGGGSRSNGGSEACDSGSNAESRNESGNRPTAKRHEGTERHPLRHHGEGERLRPQCRSEGASGDIEERYRQSRQARNVSDGRATEAGSPCESRAVPD